MSLENKTQGNHHMNRKHPRATYSTEPGELDRVFAFSGPDEKLADELGISVTTLRKWKDGKTPVPKVVYLYLKQKLEKRKAELGKEFGPWSGWKLHKRGDALECPWKRLLITFEDVKHLEDYRRAHDLTQRQADLIEQLMAERNFYKAQCTREAKYGLMLNRIFWCPDAP